MSRVGCDDDDAQTNLLTTSAKSGEGDGGDSTLEDADTGDEECYDMRQAERIKYR